jgi:ABC-2 type transport system ATP-binding protein
MGKFMSEITTISNSSFAIDARQLSKEYKSKGVKILALDNLNLSIRQGEIYGLLGENGAGKTTFVRAATTMIRPTGGSISILGHDSLSNPEDIRRLVGVLPQDAGLYEEFTVRENLLYFTKLHNIENPEQHVQELINLIEMNDRVNQRADSLSGGLRRRVCLARTLIGFPKVIFLDEPTTGLDVLVSRKVRTLIKKLVSASQATVILSTHNMFEAEKICSRVGVLHKGRLIAEDTPAGLVERYRINQNDNLEDVVAHMIGYDQEGDVEGDVK